MPYSFLGRYFDKHRSFYTYKHKDYSFNIDLENGDLGFSRKLIGFSGKHLPLDLSLSFMKGTLLKMAQFCIIKSQNLQGLPMRQEI